MLFYDYSLTVCFNCITKSLPANALKQEAVYVCKCYDQLVVKYALLKYNTPER